VNRLREWWISAPVMRVRLSLRLLTERRLALFVVIDGVSLFAGLMIAFEGNG